jgi:hypothetical protein
MGGKQEEEEAGSEDPVPDQALDSPLLDLALRASITTRFLMVGMAASAMSSSWS